MVTLGFGSIKECNWNQIKRCSESKVSNLRKLRTLNNSNNDHTLIREIGMDARWNECGINAETLYNH